MPLNNPRGADIQKPTQRGKRTVNNIFLPVAKLLFCKSSWEWGKGILMEGDEHTPLIRILQRLKFIKHYNRNTQQEFIAS